MSKFKRNGQDPPNKQDARKFGRDKPKKRDHRHAQAEDADAKGDSFPATGAKGYSLNTEKASRLSDHFLDMQQTQNFKKPKQAPNAPQNNKIPLDQSLNFSRIGDSYGLFTLSDRSVRHIFDIVWNQYRKMNDQTKQVMYTPQQIMLLTQVVCGMQILQSYADIGTIRPLFDLLRNVQDVKVVKKLNELTAIFGDFNCVEGKVNLLGGINAGISMIMTGSFNNYLTHPLFINMYEQQKAELAFTRDVKKTLNGILTNHFDAQRFAVQPNVLGQFTPEDRIHFCLCNLETNAATLNTAGFGRMNFTLQQVVARVTSIIRDYKNQQVYDPSLVSLSLTKEGMPCQLVKVTQNSRTANFNLRDVDIVVGTALEVGGCNWMTSHYIGFQDSILKSNQIIGAQSFKRE